MSCKPFRVLMRGWVDAVRCVPLTQEVKKWREEIGPVGIKDVEQYLRSDTYMTTLEYPGCEERKHPPIIFLNGMIRGKKEEMIKQVSPLLSAFGSCSSKEQRT